MPIISIEILKIIDKRETQKKTQEGRKLQRKELTYIHS